MHFFRPKLDAQIQRKQLLDAIDVLDRHQIVYHLEGGTLLGIVRDGDLLPWDHDTDISIVQSSYGAMSAVLRDLRSLGWRITERYVGREEHFARPSDVRLIKVKDRFLRWISGINTLDIFIKFIHDGRAYWIADDNVMAVAADHYDGYEELTWEGRLVKVPLRYEDYLTAKYGDWRTPVKEWHCDNEATIVKPRGQDVQ